MMIWLLYIRFIVPILGVFYGTSLIADEVDDKTITYLFTRPIPRGAVLLGKYLAYLACTVLIVLPSVMLVYFLVVPLGGGSIGAAFPDLLDGPRDARRSGLAAYGARLRLRRRPAQAAAGGRAGLRLRLGDRRAAVSGLPQAVHRRVLPAGAGAARRCPRTRAMDALQSFFRDSPSIRSRACSALVVITRGVPRPRRASRGAPGIRAGAMTWASPRIFRNWRRRAGGNRWDTPPDWRLDGWTE